MCFVKNANNNEMKEILIDFYYLGMSEEKLSEIKSFQSFHIYEEMTIQCKHEPRDTH